MTEMTIKYEVSRKEFLDLKRGVLGVAIVRAERITRDFSWRRTEESYQEALASVVALEAELKAFYQLVKEGEEEAP